MIPSDINVFVKRRKKLLKKLSKGDVAIFFSNPKQRRNNDVFYPYRQNSDFFYLTGFEEPDSILILRPSSNPESVLFVPPKDEKVEIWDGARLGPELAKKELQFDAVYSHTEVEKELPSLLKSSDKIYYKLFSNLSLDLFLKDIFSQVLKLKSRNEDSLPIFEDPTDLMGEMRLFKSAFELENIKKAAQISTEAHKELMRQCHPGQSENTLHGIFIYEIMKRGAKREAYSSIVASGENACILHYIENSGKLKKNEMLLVDAGAEYNYYASDITRTYPVNGKFSRSQKRVYKKLLEIQKNLIKFVKPGLSFYDFQSKAISSLVDLLLDERLLSGKKEKIISSLEYKKFYPHGVGHWIGMDVHDVGPIKKNKKERLFEKDMCLTVEPGLYIPKDTSSIEADLRGAGFRIEDDVLITEEGSENLSAHCPKEIEELEEIVGSKKS